MRSSPPPGIGDTSTSRVNEPAENSEVSRTTFPGLSETVFSYVCTECSTDLKKDESEQVGLVFRPDIFPGAQPHKGEVNTAKGTRSVTRCSMSMEWYVGEVCPTCGVDHNASRAYPR